MALPKLVRSRTSRSGEPAGTLQTSEAIAARLEDVERRIERLRALYESYFAGVERRAPASPRTELNRLMLELQHANIRNAALRFRHQSLAQRFTMLTTYWNRTLREIESGCYRRDLERAYRRLASRGAPLTTSEAAQLGIPASRVQAFVEQQNRRLAIPPKDDGRPAPGSSDGPRDVAAPPGKKTEP